MVEEPLLRVDHLTTTFDSDAGPVAAVNDVSFDIHAGETLGLVGESGSGKSVTALSILRLVQLPGRVAAGRVLLSGRDLMALDERAMREVRGASIALVFQEPMTALNPVFTVGNQIAEAMLVHGRATRREARAQAIELLRKVRIPNPEATVDDYPHQLSGGMRQRVMIAIALACRPSLVIADEPTTALDVTIQAQILDLLREMKSAFNLSLLLITHDLGVIAETADRVAVMYAGRIVETGPVRAILRSPQHPYTRGLLASMPPGPPGPSGQAGERGRRLQAIDGSVPMLGHLPPGCAFNPRCPDRFEPCTAEPPPDYAAGRDQLAKCYLHRPPLTTNDVLDAVG
jgi:peptide/nickel transport system ATP-binding protein